MSKTSSVSCPKCGASLPVNALAGLCPHCVMAMNLATQTEFSGETVPHGTKVLKQPPTPQELAAKFPQLEILELLGRGGMGAVYKARQKELGRIVALKILPPGIGDDPAFAERFTREARALAQLNHAGIVTLYEFGRADGLFYFLMEFVDGVNLRRLLERGRISSREALAIVPQICDALQYAHDQGIVHRDIKPENVLLDRRGRVKVADFGLAKLVAGSGGNPLPANTPQTESGAHGEMEQESGCTTGGALTRPTDALTEKGKIMGTPNYIAPEQMEHPDEVDHRADIYALGVVLYQMLTGELPGNPLQPPSSKARIDVRLDEIVLRALEQKPELRYQKASELKTQVETIATAPAPAREEIPPVRRTIGKIAARMALVAVAVAIVSEVFSLVSLHWRESEQEMWLLPFLGLSMAAALWGAWPVFRRRRPNESHPRAVATLHWLAASVALFFGLWAFYLFHAVILAPNLGLYREPDWMVQNAGWQRQQRLGAARFLLKRKPVAPQFGPTRELTLSLDNEQQVSFADLDAGRSDLRSGLEAREIVELARAGRFDVVSWLKAGQLSAEGLDLANVPVSDYHWDQDSPQNVADYFLLEWQRPKASTTLWPLADHWGIERQTAGTGMPGWMITNTVSTFYFRTRESSMGLLQITGADDSHRSVRIRYKIVQAGRSTPSVESPLTFGPVIEQTLTSVAFGNFSNAQYLDFETGTFRVPPPEIAGELRTAVVNAAVGVFRPASSALHDWLEKSGVDVVAGNLKSETELWFIDRSYAGHRTPPLDGPFEAVAPETISSKPIPPMDIYSPLQMHRAPLQRWRHDAKADIIEFHTREGNSGILEVLNLTENPPGVRIRYMLVQRAPASQPGAPPGFDPVREFSLNTSGLAAALDLDADRVLPEFKGDVASFDAESWRRTNGVDISQANLVTGKAGAGGHDLAFRRIANARWLTITPGEIASELAGAQSAQNVFLEAGNTYVVKTRESRSGVVQIVGFTAKPRGLTVRYKLVQADAENH